MDINVPADVNDRPARAWRPSAQALENLVHFSCKAAGNAADFTMLAALVGINEPGEADPTSIEEMNASANAN